MDALACIVPPALLSRSFADAAIARALHFSLSAGRSPVPEPPFVADLAAATTTTAPLAFCVPAPSALPLAPPSACCGLGLAVGRAGKRPPPTTPEQQVDADDGSGLLLPPFNVEHLLSSDAATHMTAYALTHPETAAAAEPPCFPTLDSWNVMYHKN